MVPDPYNLNDMLCCADDDRSLQDFFVFSVCVAGHSAKATHAAVERFLSEIYCYNDQYSDYDHDERDCFSEIHFYVRHNGVDGLAELLKSSGIGCYRLRARTLADVVNVYIYTGLDLRTVAAARLEEFVGIGPKTARFFMLYSRPWVEDIAVLDVHILRWMKEQGYNVPASTPSGKRYAELEKQFIAEAQQRGVHVRDFDFALWKQGAERGV